MSAQYTYELSMLKAASAHKSNSGMKDDGLTTVISSERYIFL